VLPFNTFTIHELVGFVVSVAMAAAFYFLYAAAGRRRLDLLTANFITCAAGLCATTFLTDNLVPAGMSSYGWPNGPTASELAEGTLLIQRLGWVIGVVMTVAQLHFVLCYADSRNFLRRHIYLAYGAAVLAIPLIWTPWWLPVRLEPVAETSSWSVTIPWMPEPTLAAGLAFMTLWGISNGYTLLVMYRRRHRSLPRTESRRFAVAVLVAIFIQVVFGTADLILGIFGYTCIALIPIGSTVMGILLGGVLLKERTEATRATQQLAREKTALLESIHQPLLYFDRNLRLQWANTHAVQLARVGPGAVVGLQARDLWKDREDAESLLLHEAVRTGEANQCEVAAEDLKWVIYNTPVLDDLRRPLGVLVLAVDVTPIRWAEEVLRTFSSRMLATREEERRRLATDLHDSVAQSLSALHLAVTAEIASPDVETGPAPILRRLASRLRECVEEIRRVCYDLYPPALEHFGLTLAVGRVVDQCAAAGAACRFHCAEDMRLRRFTRDIEIAVFRIAQEAVGNAVKHGRARRLEVELAYEGGRLRLSVVDDGIGFDPADVSRYGLGLSGMRERARGIGGQVLIHSAPGRTQVDVHVPCEPASGNSAADSDLPGTKSL
jgi:signal transduction histidine kinase